MAQGEVVYGIYRTWWHLKLSTCYTIRPHLLHHKTAPPIKGLKGRGIYYIEHMMASQVVDLLRDKTALHGDVINLIVSRIEPDIFRFNTIYRQERDTVWMFKVIKRTRHYVTLGALVNVNLPHRSEYKRKIRHDCWGNEYIDLFSSKYRIYSFNH